MAEYKTYQEHQESLLNLSTRYEKLRYSLQNFKDILKAHRRLTEPDKRGGGNQFAGLTHLKGIDLEYLAYQLAQNDYGGKKATSQAFRMAEQACVLLKKVDLEYIQKWHFGRVLLSAFTLAGIYHLKRIDDRGDGPYYVIDCFGSLPSEEPPQRSRHEPFPKWKSNWDEFGNRLVKPSYPCPTDLEFSPNCQTDTVWLRAVHKLESVPFRINTEVLEWAEDEKVNLKLVPPEPEDYQADRTALDKHQKKIYRLKEKIAVYKIKKNKTSGRHTATIYRGSKYVVSRTHTSKKSAEQWANNKKNQLNAEIPEPEMEFWRDWWQKHFVLESKFVRYDSRRKQFERYLGDARKLADDGRPFYQRVSMDYRGRMYLPDFSYQGSDFCRAVIEFADGAPMTQSGVASLARHTANVSGLNLETEQLMWKGRDKGLELADDLMGGYTKLVDKNVRFTASMVNKFRKAKKPFSLFRTALEWQSLGLAIEAKREKKLLSHLPISADHRNSAFQHIGMMQDDEAGNELVERCRTEDLYQFIASRSDLPPTDARELIKMIMVPWSYGGTEYSCREKVLEYRLINAGEIKYLETLDYQGVYNLVQDVYRLLNTEFQACQDYQNRITNHVEQIKDSRQNSDEGIYWRSFSGFWVYQQVFGATTNEGYVWNGENKLIQLSAFIPTRRLNWRKMKSKAPPNLVHSVDASVVHLALAIDDEENGVKFEHLIPIHDSFSVPCNEAHDALMKLQQITNVMYAYPPIDDFISDSSGTPCSTVEPRVNFPKETTYS